MKNIFLVTLKRQSKRCCFSLLIGEQRKAWAQQPQTSAATCPSAGLLFGEKIWQLWDGMCVWELFRPVLMIHSGQWASVWNAVADGSIFGACGIRPTLIGTWSRTWQCLQDFSVILNFWYNGSCLSFVYVWGCS